MNELNLLDNKNSTPILLILFNRPDYLSESINVINIILPEKLYIHIDGPRNADDEEKIKTIKKQFANINKKIELSILSQETNLGCGLGMVSAINWFFENEDYGIILEDDCIPNESFYKYCTIFLKELKENKDVFMISGDNGGELIPSKFFGESETMSIPIPIIWGWATWKDRWELYEYKKPDLNFLKLYKKLKHFKIFEKIFVISYLKKLKNYKALNTWDIHLFYQLVVSERLCIIPKLNLIKNIGFDDNATHTKETTFRSHAKTYNLDIKARNTINSNKTLNSKLLYLLQSNFHSSLVYKQPLIFIRILYLSRRLSYILRSLYSKFRKLIIN